MRSTTPTQPTLWLWEGVTPYIALEATRGTLACIARRSAPASRVAVTYATPEASSKGPALVWLASLAFRAIGEPLRGLISPDDMREELQRAGFGSVDDTAPHEWSLRNPSARRRTLLVDEHLALATR